MGGDRVRNQTAERTEGFWSCLPMKIRCQFFCQACDARVDRMGKKNRYSIQALVEIVRLPIKILPHFA